MNRDSVQKQQEETERIMKNEENMRREKEKRKEEQKSRKAQKSAQKKSDKGTGSKLDIDDLLDL